MNLELSFSNEQRSLRIVRAFTRETLQQLPLPAADAEELEKLVLGAVANAVEHAYPNGEEGLIKLTIREQHGRLELRVRDFGMPEDVEVHRADLVIGGQTDERGVGVVALDSLTVPRRPQERASLPRDGT